MEATCNMCTLLAHCSVHGIVMHFGVYTSTYLSLCSLRDQIFPTPNSAPFESKSTRVSKPLALMVGPGALLLICCGYVLMRVAGTSMVDDAMLCNILSCVARRSCCDVQ